MTVDIPTFVASIEDGDLAGAAQHPVRRQRPAGGDRPGVSAGASVRGRVRPGPQGRAGGHRSSRALRRRLGPWPRARRTATGRAIRPARRHRRRRPGWADRGRRAGPPRSRRDDLRGPAPARRRAVVRHPRVPPAQRDRRARGAPPRSPRRAHRVQRGDRAHLHARRAAQELRRRVHLGRRRAAGVPRHPRRGAEGRLHRPTST